MKQKFLISLLCLAFVLPVYMAGAQEDEQETAYEPVYEPVQEAPQQPVQEAVRETAQEAAGQSPAAKAPAPAAQAPAKKPANQGRPVQGAYSISVWINRIIAYVSQIGNMFGQTLGFRIGGTTGTAIAALVIARLLQDKAPSWVRWVLYLTGGTMVAGSGANITQVVMSLLGG
jgi:hypothetical protein